MNWHQFFQDGKDNYSSVRLINIAVGVAAIAICAWLTYDGKMSEGYFTALLAYGAGGYAAGKYAETKRKEEEK